MMQVLVSENARNAVLGRHDLIQIFQLYNIAEII
jgi:hypothetical protein